MRKDSNNVNLSLLLQPPRLSSMFFGMKSQHSTDSMFYSKQPLPRVFCALPPVSPTWCAKTVAMWMYCLYCFNHPDFLRCFLAWKVNIQLTLCSTHFYSKQPLPRVFCALPPIVPTSYVKTLAMWMYCLHWFNHPDSLRCFLACKVNIQLTLCSTLAASFSRLPCSSSNRAYIMRQDSGNVDVLSELIQPPRLSSLFFGMKSQYSTDSMFYSFLLQAASSSRLLCSSSSFAYMVCQDCCDMDVMPPLVQSKHCSQLLSLKSNSQLIHWLYVLL